ncbi:MAG: hypothetical protein KAS66_08450 [Candidatus Omnitrophica bacterium]|nr:hypothetical protein [Candidatus Omnitrophota bacterium]
MKKRNISFMVVIFLVLAGSRLAFSEEKPAAWLQTIINACRPGIACGGDCQDGFGEHCYFDTTQFDKNTLAEKADFSLSSELKEACFGVFSYSMCGACYEQFELKINGKFKKVPCDQFLKAVTEKNKSCGGCLDEIIAGCC